MVFIDYIPGQTFLVLFAIFTLMWIVQVYYYSLFLKVKDKKDKLVTKDKFPISVIVCAKNEAESLKQNLPLILKQDYPYFEVIVVNDCSEDDTDMVLAELKQNFPHLRTTAIVKDRKFIHGKKLAVALGIKGAEFDWLVLTDADCKPLNNKWLLNMQRNFVADNEIVLGYGGYEPEKGLLDKFVRYDTLFIAMQYLGLALNKRPYMGVGRNLAYKKELFFKNKGFSQHNHLLSGDDDLFINQVANNQNVQVEIAKGSFVLSEPITTWRQWFLQKKRHLTTYPYYKKGSKFLLGLELFSRAFFYAMFVVLLIQNEEPYLILGMFFLRLVYQISVVKTVAGRLNEKKLLLISPFLDILLPIFNFFVVVSNKIGSNNNKW